MFNQDEDQNLFDIQVETEDIELPGDLSLRVPTAKPATEPDKNAPAKITLPQGDTPPLLAVDVKADDHPQEGSIVQTVPGTTQQQVQTEPEKKIEPETAPTKPAAEETKKTEPATQGQQGTSGKDTVKEEKLSPTYLHAAALHEAGILPNLDLDELKKVEPDKVIDNILEASRKEVSDQVATLNEQYKNQFNEDQQQIMEMFEEGVPFDDAANITYNQVRYDTLTEAQIKENPDMQKQLIREFLYAKGHDYEYAEKQVKQSEDLEKLETDSLEYHGKLVQMSKDDEVAAREQAKLDTADRQKKNDDNLANIKKDISGTTEILKDIPLTKEDQAKVLSYMTVPSAEIVRNGKKVPISKRDEIRMQNPLEFEKRLAYYIHIGLFGDAPVLDKIEKKGETNAVNALKESLKGGDGPKAGSPAISQGDQNAAAGKPVEAKFYLPGEIASVRSD